MLILHLFWFFELKGRHICSVVNVSFVMFRMFAFTGIVVFSVL